MTISLGFKRGTACPFLKEVLIRQVQMLQRTLKGGGIDLRKPGPFLFETSQVLGTGEIRERRVFSQSKVMVVHEPDTAKGFLEQYLLGFVWIDPIFVSLFHAHASFCSWI